MAVVEQEIPEFRFFSLFIYKALPYWVRDLYLWHRYSENPRCLNTLYWHDNPPTGLVCTAWEWNYSQLGPFSGEYWEEHWLSHLSCKIIADISGGCGVRIHPWAPVPAQLFLTHTNNYCDVRRQIVIRKASPAWEKYIQREILQGISKSTFSSGIWSTIIAAKNILLAACKPIFLSE